MVSKNKSRRKAAIKRAQREIRGCIVTGVRVQHGHNVSNSNVKTKRLFRQNIHTKTLYSDVLGPTEGVKISTRGLRTINKFGGFDKYILNCKNRNLTLMAKKIKTKILKASRTPTQA